MPRSSGQADADAYEQWALGVLDAASGAEAHLLLLCCSASGSEEFVRRLNALESFKAVAPLGEGALPEEAP